MNRPQHATIDPARVRKLLKRAGLSQAELTAALAKLGVRHFRLDRHGKGKTSANLDTVGGICKILKCQTNEIVVVVGIKKRGLVDMGKE